MGSSNSRENERDGTVNALRSKKCVHLEPTYCTQTVQISKDCHKGIIGPDGEALRELERAYNVSISLGSGEDVTISGVEKEVKAVFRSIGIWNLGPNGTMVEGPVTRHRCACATGGACRKMIHVPCRHHKVVKGYIAEEAVEECSHVTVAFPLPGTGSDEVVVHGSCESVAKVVGELEDFWMSSCIA